MIKLEERSIKSKFQSTLLNSKDSNFSRNKIHKKRNIRVEKLLITVSGYFVYSKNSILLLRSQGTATILK